MEERITMILDGNGNIEMETHGFVGSVCDKVADEILVSMGGKSVKENKKSEYFDEGSDPVSVILDK